MSQVLVFYNSISNTLFTLKIELNLILYYKKNIKETNNE